AQGGAAQVEVAVFHAQVLAAIGVFLDGEGRGGRVIEDGQLIGEDFDLAGGQLEVLRVALDHLAADLQHAFAADAFELGEHLRRGATFLKDGLGYAVPVAQDDPGYGPFFADIL